MSAPGLKRTPASSFEEQYRDLGDPWHFETSRYEQRRYGIAMAMLPDLRYHRAFEPGCSIGELTARLAFRADELVAMDCSPTAVETARARCRGLDHVTFAVGELPRAWPAGPFDLVVLSEIGYYFDRAELRRTCRGASTRSSPAAHCWLSTGAAIPRTTCCTATWSTRWPARWPRNTR